MASHIAALYVQKNPAEAMRLFRDNLDEAARTLGANRWQAWVAYRGERAVGRISGED